MGSKESTKSLRNLLRERTYSCQKRRTGGGMDGEFGTDKYTLLCLKWITNNDLLHSMGNSAQYYVATWIGGELGGEWIYMYMYG